MLRLVDENFVPEKKNTLESNLGSTNAFLATITHKAQYGVKNETLYEFSNDLTSIKRCLVKRVKGYVWRKERGMVFSAWFHDVVFMSKDQAQRYEMYLRKEFKNGK